VATSDSGGDWTGIAAESSVFAVLDGVGEGDVEAVGSAASRRALTSGVVVTVAPSDAAVSTTRGEAGEAPQPRPRTASTSATRHAVGERGTGTITTSYASIPPRMGSSRSSRRAGALAMTAALVACGPPPMPLDPNADWDTDGRAASEPTTDAVLSAAPRPTPIPTARRVRWAHAADAKSFRSVPGDAPSEHGGGGYRRTLRVDEAAWSHGLRGHRPFPSGARLLEELRREGDTRVEAVFAMTKLPLGSSPSTGDWHFEVLDGELRLAVEGDLSACARCHLEAPGDAVFGASVSGAPAAPSTPPSPAR